MTQEGPGPVTAGEYMLRSRGLQVTAGSLAAVLPEVIAGGDRPGPGGHER